MLIAALNKHWRPLSYKEFWEDMDRKMTSAAIDMAEFSQEVIEKIWQPERKSFSLEWK